MTMTALRTIIKNSSRDVIVQEITNLALELQSVAVSPCCHTVDFKKGNYDEQLIFEVNSGVGKFMFRTSQVGDLPFPLTDASETALESVMGQLMELCQKVIKDAEDHAAKRVSIIDKIRGIRDNLGGVTSNETFEATAAEEAQSQYINNIRVRYEDLVAVLREENQRLHETIVNHNRDYDALFDKARDVFCGSEGDVRSVDILALGKLRDFINDKE